VTSCVLGDMNCAADASGKDRLACVRAAKILPALAAFHAGDGFGVVLF
jgi:hypothetical protein